MISFVVCSVNPDKLENFRQNVEATIGVQYEIVAVDNRTAGYSLCQAYNIGAAKAKFPYLCFAHEDIEFLTPNWDTSIIDQLAIPTTGVIGFAGATGKPATLSTWSFYVGYHRENLRETDKGESRNILINPRGERFAEVITLDGLCLFVRADVWAEVRFDEVMLDGFHLYDLDFTTAVTVAGYRNYVCYTALVEHFSRGNFGSVWMHYAKKYQAKWADHLPLYVEPQSAAKIRKVERATYRRMSYFIIKREMIDCEEMKTVVKKTMQYFPFRPDSYILWWKLKKYLKAFGGNK